LAAENQSLTPAEQLENAGRKDRLFKLIESGECILMAGAGCSGDLYPTWMDLMNLLTKEARLEQSDFPEYKEPEYDYLSYADKFKAAIGNKYHNVIYREYKCKEPSHKTFHETLVSLPFRGITTTNYDEVLEYAIAAVTRRPGEAVWIGRDQEEAKISAFLASLNDRRPVTKVFHIHGINHSKESIILCGQEYHEKYGFSYKVLSSTMFQDIQGGIITEQQFEALVSKHGLKWTTHRKILWALLATRRILFLGFSLSDPYFNKMLEYVSDDLHTYNQDNHFIALRITSESKDRDLKRAKELKRKYGVETVFFEDNDSYQGLERFIEEISQTIEGTRPSKTLDHDAPKIPTKATADLVNLLMKNSLERHNNDQD
jgi:hypothetical protein